MAVVEDSIRELADEIENLAADEQDKFDNLTEGLQAADSGMRLEECADQLSNSAQSLFEVCAQLAEVVEA